MDTNWKLGLIETERAGENHPFAVADGPVRVQRNHHILRPLCLLPLLRPPPAACCQVLAELCPAAEEWEQLQELSYLEVDPEALERPFFTLSNGEQTKVQLAALFLNQGRFLLIDEPTNHLDTAGRAWCPPT